MKKSNRATTNDLDALAKEFYDEAAEYLPSISSRLPTGAQAVRQLQAFHTVGKIANRLMAQPAKYGACRTATLAKAVGRKSEWLNVARRFAEMFDEKAVAQLCSDVPMLRVGHLPVLLGLDTKERKKKIKRIVARNWSPAEFRAQVHSEKGPFRDPRGRKPARPDNPEACLQKIAEQAERLLRSTAEALTDDKSPLKAAIGSRAIREFESAMDKATAALQQLHRACEKAESALSPVRKATRKRPKKAAGRRSGK